jgi:hypothetical protein
VELVINTDAETYGGSNVGNFGGVQTEEVPPGWAANIRSSSIYRR